MPGLPGRAIAGPKVSNAKCQIMPHVLASLYCTGSLPMKRNIVLVFSTIWYNSSHPAMKYIGGMIL